MKRPTLVASLSCWVLLAACEPASEGRAGEIEALIRKNLNFSAHMTWAADARTVEAVRAATTAADVPALIALLGSDDAAVRYAAAGVLESYGAARIWPALEAARADPELRAGVEEAMRDMRAKAVASGVALPAENE